MRVVVSWSGGKDSCFALYNALSEGFDVSCLMNFITKEGKAMSHEIDANLISAQARAIGIPLVQKEVTWDTYEEKFKEILTELKQTGIEGAVFGDIDIQEHKDWVTRVCSEVDILALEPLWGLTPEHILTNFIMKGFEAIVVNVRADIFGSEWLGRRVNREFLEKLQKIHNEYNIHICGELGEYHTLVIDGPIFKRRIKITVSNKVQKMGYWRYWLLDILNYSIEEK